MSANTDLPITVAVFAMMRDGVIFTREQIARISASDNCDWLGCGSTPPQPNVRGIWWLSYYKIPNNFSFHANSLSFFYYFSFNRGLMKDVFSIISQIICLCHYVFEKLSKLSFDGDTYSP